MAIFIFHQGGRRARRGGEEGRHCVGSVGTVGTAFKPKLGLSRKVEGVAGAQTGNTVRASLFQRPDPELGVRVYSLALGELITMRDARGDVLSILASSLKPEGTSVSSSGLDISVQSWSLSISGRGKTPGADQARRLTSSTEADWGGRSHGGPGHGVALPAAGGGWALSGERREALTRALCVLLRDNNN